MCKPNKMLMRRQLSRKSHFQFAVFTILKSTYFDKLSSITNQILIVCFFFLISAWGAEKQIQTLLEAMKIGQLDQNLCRFYAEARTKKGEDYSRSTLLGFRHSIERYLN